MYKGQRYVEVEWTVGPIPFEDNLGRERVLRYSSGISSGQDFYTDINGRGMQRRTIDTRATWNLNVTEEIAGNYYPVTAAAYIQDDDAQFAVLTDRAQGENMRENMHNNNPTCHAPFDLLSSTTCILMLCLLLICLS